MKSTIDALNYVSDSLTDNIVVSLLEPLSKHHYGTYIHSIHVAFLSVQIGIKCNLSENELRVLALGSVLHDVGKISIPIEILDKKTQLTDEEFDIIKKHPENGFYLLRNKEIDEEISKIALLHHKKLNGTGYPLESNDMDIQKILNEPIDNIVQIVQVADMFEAIVTTRAYKKKYNINKAIELLEKDVNSGILEYQYVSVLNNLSVNNQLLLQTI